MAFEYKIVPAPAKGVKRKGLKTPEARFAAALEDAVNDLAGGGWEFVRTESLPSEERKGLTGTQTVTRHMLVFRRALPVQAPLDAPATRTEATPQAETPEDAATPAAEPPAPVQPTRITATGPAPAKDLPTFSARREDPAIARPVRNLFADRDGYDGPEG